MAKRRRQVEAAPAQDAVNPNRVYAKTLQTPRGEVRAWFRYGECQKVRVAGVTYGWGEGPAVWAAVLDGTFRPDDFGKHNSLRWSPAPAATSGAGENNNYSEGEDFD